MIAGLKLAAISAGVAAVIAFGGGWKVRDAFCDAAAAKRELQIVRAQLADAREQVRRHAANTADVGKRLREREAREAELDEKLRKAEDEIAKRNGGACPAHPDDITEFERL